MLYVSESSGSARLDGFVFAAFRGSVTLAALVSSSSPSSYLLLSFCAAMTTAITTANTCRFFSTRNLQVFRSYSHSHRVRVRPFTATALIQDDVTSAADAPQILLEHLIHDEIPGAIVSKLTLNRPKAANAMGSTMLDELRNALDQLEGKETFATTTSTTTRCLVVTSSNPKVFSAGADLKERNKMTQQQASDFVRLLRSTFHRVSQLPMPVISSMEGLALGGGLELALACDIRVASSNSIMGLPETTLAIIPGAGGTQRLPRLIGMSRAMELVFTGRRITADVAYQYGLVNQVVPPEEADATSLALAWQMSKSGPIALRAAKEAMLRGMQASNMTEALETERECYERTLPTKDRLEGLSAFQEGRPPRYTGE